MRGYVTLECEVSCNAYRTMMRALRYWGGSAKQVADEIEYRRKQKAKLAKKQQNKQSKARSQSR